MLKYYILIINIIISCSNKLSCSTNLILYKNKSYSTDKLFNTNDIIFNKSLLLKDNLLNKHKLSRSTDIKLNKLYFILNNKGIHKNIKQLQMIKNNSEINALNICKQYADPKLFISLKYKSAK